MPHARAGAPDQPVDGGLAGGPDQTGQSLHEQGGLRDRQARGDFQVDVHVGVTGQLPGPLFHESHPAVDDLEREVGERVRGGVDVVDAVVFHGHGT